ncbi:MAG TPA: CHAT domain-containing protein [Pyrinomonadaceae bacterium]|nr:CHAT domain-containing protein [Pyrinomonadaceae bacterium]
MGSSISEETIREYLLGRVSDESTLTEIEDQLFADEEFCSDVALAEDGLINDYVVGRLNGADAGSFEATLQSNRERRFKVDLTQSLKAKALAHEASLPDRRPSFIASLKAFFQQPQYVGVFAILLIVIVGSVIYFGRKQSTDDLAELRSIYQQSRPTETRLAEFGYAPFTELRGTAEPAHQSRLRLIENNLIEATQETSNAETHHALGVFYLTQREYDEAVKEFEAALKFAPGSARIHNDLGVAHFERSKSVAKEKQLADLAQSLERFTRATELDSNFLEALFNEALATQAMGLPREAKKLWSTYLEKDASSPWAGEARKHLSEIESEQTLFKSKEAILSDFLVAYRNHDESRAQKIHNETKGLLKAATVPLQLSRRYLEARLRDNQAEARESIEALTYIGNLEQTQIGDSFFFELAEFYRNVETKKLAGLIQAKDVFAGAEQSSDFTTRIAEFEKSRNLFAGLGNTCEAAIAEIWAVQYLPDVGRVRDSRPRAKAIIESAAHKKFRILEPPAWYSLGMSASFQKEISESHKNLKSGLRLAEAGQNAFEVEHAREALALGYSALGELEPALSYASEMLTERRHYYENPSQYWRNKGTLADLFLKLKFFATSLSFSRERLSRVQETNPGSSLVNDTLRRMIHAATANGDFGAALSYANESMQIAQARGESAENARTTAEVYLLLADLKSKMNACTEALSTYDQVLELSSRLPEVTDSLYKIHKGKLFCFQQLGQQENFSNELKTVIQLSEEYRNTIREDASRQAFFTNEQEVFDAVTANAIQRTLYGEAFDHVEAAKARSLLEFVESGRSIAAVERDYASSVKPLSLTEIQARLPEQVQIVQYAVLPGSLAIWTVSKSHFNFIEKQISAAELSSKVAEYQSLITSRGPESEIKRLGQDLYRTLIPGELVSGMQLCVLPDKSLHQLAFATLISAKGKYLLQEYALFYAPSASVLVLATDNAKRKEHKSETLLAVGNPEFDREENPRLPSLEAAEDEATTIAEGYAQSLELLGPAATREQFLRNLTRAEVIHFAGHFVANPESPGNSKLLFSGSELRSSELDAYKLPRAKLVVLSACETGFERFNKSEGAIGIARTLLALGAPLVVASQWKVDSEPTKDLMIAFHRNRKQKRLTSAESLRQAQLEMLASERTNAPFYWAAFSLFGAYSSY